jgi:iron complex transport system substrate-binding protein
LVGASEKSAKLIAELENAISQARITASGLTIKPKVYFEEWDEPIMCGIRWAVELIEIAGGVDCFPELSRFHSAKDRVIQASQVIERQPDIIIGSWCGKKFQPKQVMAREGWDDIPAVKNGLVREIKSADILQPGPSLITHGLKQVESIIQEWKMAQAPI